MFAANAKKRSFGNQNESPQLSKKFKSEKLPNGGTPQATTPKGQKQNKNNSAKKPQFPQKSPGTAVANIKKEATPSPKTPKLKMFGGTGNLPSSASNVKRESPAEAASPKQKHFKNKSKANKKQANNVVADKKESLSQNAGTDEQTNRHKRRRENRKHKKIEAKTKHKELLIGVAEGDVSARNKLQEMIDEMEQRVERSKTCEKKIKHFKRLLGRDADKSSKKTKQEMKNAGNEKLKTNKQVKGKPVAQKQLGKQNLMSKKKEQKQVLPKIQQTALDSEDSSEAADKEVDEEEDATDEEEAATDEEASDEEEDAADEVEEEESSNEEASDEDALATKLAAEVDSEESDDESEEEEDSEDDDENGTANKVPANTSQKNKQAGNKTNKQKQQQVGNKNKINQVSASDINQIVKKGNSSRYVAFVGNLPYTATKEEIREHFKKVGEIADIRIPTDGNKPKGFAYVEVKNADSYQQALSLHHTFIGGRRINVLYTQGGKKNSDNKKSEIKAKNFKLQAMRNQGQLAGSVKADQKRSVRRAKKKQFERKQ